MMNKSEENKHEYIRLLKPSFALKAMVWFVAFLLSLIIALFFDSTISLWVFVVLLNSLGMVLVSALADLTASIAERKRIQPNQWFIADIEREKSTMGHLELIDFLGIH